LKKALLIILGLLLVGAIGGLIYIVVAPKVGESFTEFYILGPEGKAENYPEQLAVGESAKVIAGVVNHEYKQMSYRIRVLIAGQESYSMGPILLEDGGKWEGEMTFMPEVPGDNQKVEFILYQGDDILVLVDSLYLWINVKIK